VLVHALVDEAALRRAIGPANVMTAQLEHLAALAGNSLVTLQVIPLAATLPVLRPSFTVLSFPHDEEPDVACYATAAGHLITSKHENQASTLRRDFSALARAAIPPADSARLINDLTGQKS
jgi:hypothetical protein